MLTHFIADNITIQTHLDSDIRNIEGDPGKIEEIMMNLIINARDALPEGGKIIIQTKHIKKEDLKSVQKKTSLDSDYIKISVEDTGIGMDEETQNMIFEPFFTTKKEGEGTGLGLTIVREFVSQHNGWIEFDSQKGQGTTFNVYLPYIHENITEQ
jgi:signal transduction histidine kinase